MISPLATFPVGTRVVADTFVRKNGKMIKVGTMVGAVLGPLSGAAARIADSSVNILVRWDADVNPGAENGRIAHVSRLRVAP